MTLPESKLFMEPEDFKDFAGEASLFQMGTHHVKVYLGILEIDLKERWFYFSRLFVPKKLRQQGISHKLLKKVEEWADENKINIICEINPYGDLKLRGLQKLYTKHGFQRKSSRLYYRFYQQELKMPEYEVCMCNAVELCKDKKCGR